MTSYKLAIIVGLTLAFSLGLAGSLAAAERCVLFEMFTGCG
jgi:hypothetical protein